MDDEIRRFQAEDWAALREVRLAALAESPYAFFSTLAGEADRDEAGWRDWTGRTVLYGAWRDGQPVGLAGTFRRDDGRWHIVSMWVAPAVRGTGVAARLVGAVTGYIRDAGAPAVTLWVTDVNDRARAFYTRLGFRFTGVRQPLHPQTPDWESEMILPLTAAATNQPDPAP